MSVLQHVTRGSVLQGSGVLVILAGAVGLDLSAWSRFGFVLTGVPLWCFGVVASIGGVMYFLGPMVFGSTSARAKRTSSESAERMLFLYLRPFELDTRSLLQLMIGASTGVLIYLTLMEGLWWPLSFAPLFINISKEQGLQDALEPIGDFIAFGEPGRKLDPVGASRQHIGENWREEIRQYMRRARLVIIRPGNTDSMRWEIEQVIKTTPPERILFYLRVWGSRRHKERVYSAFRSQLRSLLQVELPERLGRAKYLVFDHAWNPRFLREHNRPIDLLKEVFLGDVGRDRFRSILEAAGIEYTPVPDTLPVKIVRVVLWLSAFILAGLVLVAFLLAVIALGVTILDPFGG